VPLTPQQYYVQQTANFMMAFNSVAEYPVAIQHPAQFSKLVRPGAWQWDQSVPPHAAFVRSPMGGPKEYWVNVDFSGYRPALKGFLSSHAGVTDVPSYWHADHVLNAALARRHRLGYVRLALVQQPYNVGYGALFEKRLTQMDANSKSMYLLDFLVMMKLLHIAPPRGEADYMGRKQDVARSFVQNGFDGSQELVVSGLDGFFKLWKVL
jgi:hypothetical protein